MLVFIAIIMAVGLVGGVAVEVETEKSATSPRTTNPAVRVEDIVTPSHGEWSCERTVCGKQYRRFRE